MSFNNKFYSFVQVVSLQFFFFIITFVCVIKCMSLVLPVHRKLQHIVFYIETEPCMWRLKLHFLLCFDRAQYWLIFFAVDDNKIKPSPLSSSLKRCGKCLGCYRTEDCGRCDGCRSANRARHKCRQRQCLNSILQVW